MLSTALEILLEILSPASLTVSFMAHCLPSWGQCPSHPKLFFMASPAGFPSPGCQPESPFPIISLSWHYFVIIVLCLSNVFLWEESTMFPESLGLYHFPLHSPFMVQWHSGASSTNRSLFFFFLNKKWHTGVKKGVELVDLYHIKHVFMNYSNSDLPAVCWFSVLPPLHFKYESSFLYRKSSVLINI